MSVNDDAARLVAEAIRIDEAKRHPPLRDPDYFDLMLYLPRRRGQRALRPLGAGPPLSRKQAGRAVVVYRGSR